MLFQYYGTMLCQYYVVTYNVVSMLCQYYSKEDFFLIAK